MNDNRLSIYETRLKELQGVLKTINKKLEKFPKLTVQEFHAGDDADPHRDEGKSSEQIKYENLREKTKFEILEAQSEINKILELRQKGL